MAMPTNPNPWEFASESVEEETPWIIINTSEPEAFFQCQRCEEAEIPTFPVDMKVFIENINTFVAAHRDCEDEDEQECKTCDGEGTVEGALVCGNVRAGGCSDGMCGGCYPTIPCPDCGGNSEPDWDAIAKDRAESRALRDSEPIDEVEWESPI